MKEAAAFLVFVFTVPALCLFGVALYSWGHAEGILEGLKRADRKESR